MKTYAYCILLMSLLLPKLAAADATQALSDILSTYETVQGQFEQTLADDKGEVIQASSGRFIVKTPGYFYWSTEEPYPQLLVSNLKSVWLHDPDLEQVTIRPYEQTVEQSPALLLSGNVDIINEHYTVKQSSEQLQRYTLTPKAKANSAFTEIEMVFADAILVTMLLKDTLQQTTTFTFRNLSINDPVQDSTFDFEIPEGVDVLNDG